MVDTKSEVWIKPDGNPIISGHLVCQDKRYAIRCFTWLSFMMRINEIMRNHEIEFPIGEDDKIRMVRKKAVDAERIRR